MRIICALAFLTFVTACSHPIEIVGEGGVVSVDQDRYCNHEHYLAGQDRCTKNYVLGAYREDYLVDVSWPDWYFDRWENYCTEDTLGECSFDVPASVVRLAWGHTAPPLVAVFTERDGSEVPGSKIISADGRQWIRPRLFNGVLWSDIAAICPGGACSGELMGFDITGWTWASVEDLNSLFNFYIGSEALGPGPSVYGLPGIEWQTPFWDDAWGQSSFNVKDLEEPLSLDNLYRILEGQTRDCLPHPESGIENVYIGGLIVMEDHTLTTYGNYSTQINYGAPSCESTAVNSVGAWFFREAP